MNIYLAKKLLKSKIGNNVSIKYSLGRNKYDYCEGILYRLYDNIFTIIDDKNRIRSYSYNDLIMKQIKIDFK